MLSSNEDLTKWFRRVVNEIDDAVADAVDDAVEYGASTMKELIGVQGTGNSWDESWDRLENSYPGRYQSAPGRIASGDMVDAVTFESGSTGSHTYEGEFGWVGDAKPYWLSQEHGFTHNFTGGKIEGMYALADAADLAMKELDEALDRRLGNV